MKHRTGAVAIALSILIVTSAIALPAQEVSDTIAARDRSSAGPIRLRTVVSGLDHPWAVAPLPEGGMLITERPGRLWFLTPEPHRLVRVTGLPELYRAGQGGLLDIITSEEYATDRTVYFSYSETASGGAVTAVARATLVLERSEAGESGGGDAIAAARLDDVETIFRLNRVVSGGRHFGSRLVIGDDGYLYITVGERGQPEFAQDPRSHQGSVVRIDTDGSIPAGNPRSVTDPATGRSVQPAPGLYSWGHRNAQGIARHPETGEIWLHEHGPRGGDEINIIQAGANYGWPRVTHGVAYSGREITDYESLRGYADPLLHWTPSIAPSGMAFISGPSPGQAPVPEWEGDILVGALSGQHLRRVDLDRSGTVRGEEELFSGFGRFRDVRVAPDGAIYILTDESPDGGLFRLERGR